MLRQGALLGCAAACAGHGGMVEPPSWLDPDGKFGFSPDRLSAGCTGKAAPGQIEEAQGCLGEWYSNYTFISGKPTIPSNSKLLTLRRGPGGYDWTKKNPWRHPGTAPVFSPCGVDGGNPDGCPVGNPNPFPSCGAGGYGHGPDMRTLKGNTNPKEWKLGGEAEVGWSIVANHGGGYQYRLCKTPAGGFKDLTEECFQKTPLPFVGDKSWAVYSANLSRYEFTAMRTTEGTSPAGSQWSRNPIPGCYNKLTGPYANGADGVCSGPQFDPPLPGLYGFNPGGGNGHGNVYAKIPDVTIVDKVQVPADIEAGDYVISFRYDCEQTSQVWQQCGSVKIS